MNCLVYLSTPTYRYRPATAEPAFILESPALRFTRGQNGGIGKTRSTDTAGAPQQRSNLVLTAWGPADFNLPDLQFPLSSDVATRFLSIPWLAKREAGLRVEKGFH